jgi:hypothetical protein
MSHSTTFPREIKIIILATVVSLLAGCATMRYAGAPEPTSNLNTDIDELSRHFEGSNSITNYYKNESEKARNEFIVGRLTLMNLRYLKFIRNLTSERQLLDSATAITAMGLGLAGSMVPLALTTKILAAVSAGVAGTKEVIDKNYYFEKTIPALVAQMNAERQKALTPILEGMQKDIQQYPLGKAVVDLNNYYIAGTFAGAIQSIQADASLTEQKAKDINLILTMPSPEERIATKQLHDFFDKIWANYRAGNLSEFGKLRNALTFLKVDVPPEDKAVFDRFMQMLQEHKWQERKITSVDIKEALTKASFNF